MIYNGEYMNKIDISREDYLKSIYELIERNGKATNKELAAKLGIAAASVTEMIRRLCKSGYVYTDKKAIYLTENGKIKAKNLLT